MIAVTEISKEYEGRPVVNRVSFEVKKGQNLILLGTSGSGKTTLLKMLNRLIEPSSGTIFLDGQDVRNMPVESLRRNMGYVIQQSGLFPHYTVRENIALVPKLLRWSSADIRRRTDELIQLVGLSAEFLSRYPAELSGGQKQRVGIARALAANPSIILLDEPFGALDPITKQQIVEEFTTLETLKEKTVVMVTHDVFEAITIGDTICLLDQGRVQQIGTSHELLFSPANDFVRSFFDAQRFRLELQIIRLEEIEKIMTSPERSQDMGDMAMAAKAHRGDSLWKTLGVLERENKDFIQVDESKIVLSRETLLTLFYRYKKLIGKEV